MTYTNELPSNLLLKEMNMRLFQLGCAVTADKKTTRRNLRAGNARAGFPSQRATGASLVMGRVHADE